MTAFLISDSLIYLTPKGAKEVLRNYEAKRLCEEISNEKQEIINKMHLKNELVLEEKQRAEKKAFEANEALKITRKKLFRANVERYAYRILTVATTIFIISK